MLKVRRLIGRHNNLLEFPTTQAATTAVDV